MNNKSLINKRFEFLEHTADAKFRAYGKNLEEAFSNAVIATTTIMTDPKKINSKTKKQIDISSKTKESLFFDFIQELLFLFDTDGFITGEVKELKITKKENNYNLSAVLFGDKAKNYDIERGIKSATYSEMIIKEEKDFVVIQAVHDI